MISVQKVFEAALRLLDESEAAVEARRKELIAEVGIERVRATREHQLASPFLTSTPFVKCVDSVTQTAMRLRDKANAAAQELVAAYMALEAAESVRTELIAAERREAAANSYTDHPSGFPEWRSFVDSLFNRGVTRHTLKQLGNLEGSIFADLMRWKTKDPRCEDHANPWRFVLDGYATTVFQMWERGRAAPRLSMPGEPPEPETYGDRYWRRDQNGKWGDGLDRSARRKRAPADKRGRADPDATFIPNDKSTLPAAGISPDRESLAIDDFEKASEHNQEPDDRAAAPAGTNQTGMATAIDAFLIKPWLSVKEIEELADKLVDLAPEMAIAPWVLAGVDPALQLSDRLIPALEESHANGNSTYSWIFIDYLKENNFEGYVEDVRHDMKMKYMTKIYHRNPEVLALLESLNLI